MGATTFTGNRRAEIRPGGLRLEPVRIDRNELVADALDPRLAQQHLNRPLALVVGALTEVVLADSAFRVGHVDRGPVSVAERLPHRVVAVKRDRVLDPHSARGFADVLDLALERELGRVDADNDQVQFAVLLVPGADEGERSQPVDTGVRPEVDEHHLARQILRGQRR
jgi:hypothetical protein